MKQWLMDKTEPTYSLLICAPTYDEAWTIADGHIGVTMAINYCDKLYCNDCPYATCPEHPDA